MSNYPNQRIHALRKSGRIDDAYRLGKDLLARHPDDKYLCGAFGWVLYDKAKAVVRRSVTTAKDAAELESILEAYTRLDLERPDLLFSLLVRIVVRMDPPPKFLPRFLQWAGLTSFRSEDFAAQEDREREVVYPPLVERVATSVAKMLGGPEIGIANKEFAMALIDLALQKSQVQRPIWLRYRKALLLADLGKTMQARNLLLPVVREKSAEYWAWHALARIEKQRDPNLALALCTKALVVCHDEGFAVRVLTDVAELAVELGHNELAKWAVDRQMAVRQERGWKVSESLLGLTTAAWYKASNALEDSKRLLEDLSVHAEEVLWEGAWQDSSFLEQFVSKKGRVLIKVGLKHGSDTVESVIRADRLKDSSGLEAGAPLQAVIENEAGKPRLLAIKRRPVGVAYDCLMEVYGVLDHHNPAKRLASIYVSATEFCLLHYNSFELAKDWDVGSPIIMRCTRNRDRLTAYEARPSQFRETDSIQRLVGPIKIHSKGFGFVRDAFLTPVLIQSASDSAEVEVIAVRKPKGRDGSGKLGWKAICVTDPDFDGSVVAPDSYLA